MTNKADAFVSVINSNFFYAFSFVGLLETIDHGMPDSTETTRIEARAA